MHERNTCKIRRDSANESVANRVGASLLFSTGECGVNKRCRRKFETGALAASRQSLGSIIRSNA